VAGRGKQAQDELVQPAEFLGEQRRPQLSRSDQEQVQQIAHVCRLFGVATELKPQTTQVVNPDPVHPFLRATDFGILQRPRTQRDLEVRAVLLGAHQVEQQPFELDPRAGVRVLLDREPPESESRRVTKPPVEGLSASVRARISRDWS
jgi:hypothetical protein